MVSKVILDYLEVREKKERRVSMSKVLLDSQVLREIGEHWVLKDYLAAKDYRVGQLYTIIVIIVIVVNT